MGATDALLPGLLAGEGGAPRILFPLPEQQFLRDRGVASRDQRLEAWIAAWPGQPVGVRIEGLLRDEAPAERLLEYPFRLALPLEPGTYRLEVFTAAGRDSIRYHVR